MKKVSIIIVTIAILASCQKKKEEEVYASSLDAILEEPMAKYENIHEPIEEIKNETQTNVDNEEYASLIENPFELTKNQPV
ncbi:hypothetical protein, partial [Chryseobacterium balustinum]